MTMPVIVVTGSTDGIGLETARVLATHGVRVVLHGRDPDRLEAAARAVDRQGNRWPAATEFADLSSLQEVRSLAAAASVHLALGPEERTHTGEYFDMPPRRDRAPAAALTLIQPACRTGRSARHATDARTSAMAMRSG